jgi:hypothetical protein
MESILWRDTRVCCWPESGNDTSEESFLLMYGTDFSTPICNRLSSK